MKSSSFAWLLAFVLSLAGLWPVAAVEKKRPPNIVFILADDLGYAELGSFGQKKIRTPHLDRLAAGGMRLTQHYSGNAVCAPSRCVLMTGMHPGRAWVRNNREVQPEGQTPIPSSTVTVAALLKKKGYATGAFGKWGLGPPGSEGDPLKQGFDRFYGYNCQRHAHNFYPTYLWDDDRRVDLDNPPFAAHQRLPDDADPSDPASYARYAGKEYGPDLIADQALRFIREHKDRPFFLYFPSLVPHLALQVPEDSLAEYKGKWPDPPYPGGKGYLPHHTPRAAYAAMVTRFDRDAGRMMALIKELGLEENTIFVFTSDNGPTFDRHGGSDSFFFESAGPLRGFKGSLYEGGIRVPTIVAWKGRVAPGTVSDYVSGFEDWMPTLLELIGAPDLAPGGIDGISVAPVLLGKEQPARPFLYREFPASGGQQSIRVGDWKAVRQNLMPRGKEARPNLHLELYNLKEDIGETTDVSAKHPELVAKLDQLMKEQRTRSELFPIPALDRL
jgi:arylsulfatase A